MSRIDSYMEREIGWVVVQGVIFALFVFAVVFGDTLNEVPGLIFARMVGVVIGVGGAGVALWALVAHGGVVSPLPRPVENAQLIDSGPYRHVRHPMYSGVVIFTVGVGLAYANPAVLLVSATFLVFFMAKTEREEEMLVVRVEGYRAYRSEVAWRIIPFVM